MARLGMPIAVAIALLAAGCWGESDDPSASVNATTASTRSTDATPADGGTLRLADAACGFEPGALPIPAGLVTFAVVNDTDTPAAFTIARLEGATYRDFLAHIDEEIRLAKAAEPGLGHPSFAVPLTDVPVDPGGSDELSVTLEPGAHALLCERRYGEVGELRPFMAIGPVEVASDT